MAFGAPAGTGFQPQQGNPDLLDALLTGLTPDHLSQLDQILGIEAPPANPQPLPAESLGHRIIGSFSGAEQTPMGPPQSFLEGLAQGAVRGLGSAGTRARAERAKAEATLAERQKQVDLQRQKIMDERNAARRALVMAGVQGQIAAGNQPPVAIQGPNGPVYVPRGQAVGKAPAETKQAGEPLEVVKTPQGLRYLPRSQAAGKEPGSVSAAANVPVTGPAADNQFKELALQYIRTGTYPRSLIGKEDRDAFLAYVHANYPGTDIAKNAAVYKADQGALAKQQANLDQVTTSANTLSTSINTLRGVLNQVPETGFTGTNGFVRWVAKSFGNQAVPTFNQQLHVVQNETARITGGNWAGGGTLLDSEKKDMQAVQSGNFTRQQLTDVADIVESDKIGRLNAGRRQVNAIKRRLDFAESGQEGKKPPPDTEWYGFVNTDTKAAKPYSVTDPNGKTWQFSTRGKANNFIEQVNAEHGY